MTEEKIQHCYHEETQKMGVLRLYRDFETEEQKQQYLTLIEQGTVEEEAYITACPPTDEPTA
ncbi:hypothetical protein [Methanococcus maripaludis]|uniref:Uncharacterized protein n=1 Tax=Methanococcus maripaludis TaxID=39152 RepID=A0A7J9S5A5_METMI|nr:hypothetical protein [Methanococcus maripaludis]MBB6067862.1 hypothetical protein [Methanococcus maripaludis]